MPKISIKNIEDLADSKNGKVKFVQFRPESHDYNRLSLLASIIAANGEAKAEEWASNLVANLAIIVVISFTKKNQRF